MRVCTTCRSRYSKRAQFCGIDGTALLETNVDPLIGSTLDRYRIVEAIGEGGAGCVYRAEHTTLQASFAIKVLLGDLGSDGVFVARLGREAQAASRIRSTHVAAVIDFATTPEGLSYLVMEYVHGVPLDALIRKEGPLPPLRAARIAAGIASGLAAAHALGFVHRDIKPSNVLVVHEGDRDVAKLVDFGIVRSGSMAGDPAERETEGSPEGSADEAHQLTTEPGRLTRDGKLVGTPAYMSPEQWTNSEVGPSADLYSLGLVLFEMVAGRRAFQAEDIPQLCQMHFHAQPPRLPTTQGLEEIAARLMAKSPAGRPPNAKAVRDDLEQVIVRLSLLEEGPGAAGGLVTPASMPTPGADLDRTRQLTDPQRESGPGPGPGAPRDGAPQPAGRRGRSRLLVGAGVAAVAGALVVALASRGPAASGRGLEAGVATVQPEPNPPPRPDLARQIEQTLSGRGLTFDDLAELDLPRTERGRLALTRHDEAGAADLVAFASSAPIAAGLLRRKLDRLDGPLAAKVRALGGPGGRQLEERYLSFYKSLNAARVQPELDALARGVAAFERELGAAVQP
jgi:serine/threonine-protein kinase